MVDYQEQRLKDEVEKARKQQIQQAFAKAKGAVGRVIRTGMASPKKPQRNITEAQMKKITSAIRATQTKKKQGVGGVIRKAVTMATGGKTVSGKSGKKDYYGESGKRVKWGRGRRKGTYTMKQLPNGQWVKMSTAQFKRVSKDMKMKRRVAIAQQQYAIKQQQRQFQEQAAMQTDGRFEQDVALDSFLAGEGEQIPIQPPRQQMDEFGRPMFEPAPRSPMNRFISGVSRFGSGVAALGGGRAAGQPRQPSQAEARLLQERRQFEMAQGRPLTHEEELKWKRQIAKETNILNAPNVFNNRDNILNSQGQPQQRSLLRVGELEAIRDRSLRTRIRW